MGKKKPRNKTKKRQKKHDPRPDRRRNNFDHQSSNAERDDKIEEKSENDFISRVPDDGQSVLWNRDDKIEEKSENDFISRLPDDVLQYILSLLPLREAVRTSFLSATWRGVWQTGIETIQKDGNIGEIFGEICYFLDDSMELGLSTRVQEFSCVLCLIKHSRRLRFNFGHSSFLIATISSIGSLHLHFYSKKHESPIDFDLRWTGAFYYFPPFYDAYFSFDYIRCLHLIAVTKLTSEAVSSILSRLRFLESLTIIECHGLHSLRINTRFAFSKLMIFDCLQLKSLHISSDRIDIFRFRGLLPSLNYESSRGTNSLSRVDAMLDCRGGPGYDHFESKHSQSLLSVIVNARILTLCRWTFEAMIRQWTTPAWAAWMALPKFVFSVLKELQWIENEVDEHSIDVLISFLKRCPSLKKLYINIDPTSYSGPRTRKYTDQVLDCKRLRYLEIVQLEGVTKTCDKLLLATRLLDVATTKTKIIAKSNKNQIWKFERVSSSQPSQNRNPLLKKYYMFVEVNEEETGKLRSKHSHADL